MQLLIFMDCFGSLCGAPMVVSALNLSTRASEHQSLTAENSPHCGRWEFAFREIFRRQHKEWDKPPGGLFWSVVHLGLGLIQPFLQGCPWIWSQQPWLQEPEAWEQFKALSPKCQSELWSHRSPGLWSQTHPNMGHHCPSRSFPAGKEPAVALIWLKTFHPPKTAYEAAEATEGCEAVQWGDASSTTTALRQDLWSPLHVTKPQPSSHARYSESWLLFT